MSEPTGIAAIDQLLRDIEKTAIRYADNYVECECDDPDASCWYHLSEVNQRKLVLDYIVDVVTP